MENNRFLKIVIVFLLLVNIGTLTFLWVTKMPPPPPPHHGGGNKVFEFLVKELQLTDSQQKQYATLRDEHHAAMEATNKHNMELRHQLFDGLHTASTDTMMVHRLTDSIAANQQKLEMITFNHFRQVRAMCSAEQQKKFDEVIDEALRMMNPKPPRPQDGEHGHPPPPDAPRPDNF